MANIPALVTVNGVELPEPSSYEGTTSTIVDSGRNVQGKVVGAVVRHDVAKVSMSWNYLTARQWADILSLFTTNFYCTVKFYNQATAGYTTVRCMSPTAPAACGVEGPKTGGVMGWIGCKLSLVEV